VTFRRLALRAAVPSLPALVAAVLSLWGIGFGLPFNFRPDEDVLVGRAVRMALGWGVDPHFYVYPPLGIDAMAGAEWLLRLVAPGHVGSAVAVDPSWEYLVARLVSVAGFVAAAAFVALAARRFYGTAAGLIAGLALGVAPLAVQNAHFARVDMLGVTFLALTLWLGARATSTRGWLLAGVAAGLAAASKYTFGAVAVYLLLLTLHLPAERWRSLGAATLGAVLAFAATLLSTLHPVQLAHGLGFLGGRALAQYQGTEVGFIYHPTVSLPLGLGPGGLLLAVVGIGLALFRRRPADIALLGFLACLYALIGFTHEVFIRYTLPAFPALAVLAGGLFRDGVEDVRDRVLAALAVALLLPSAQASATSDWLLDRTDTRVVAARWLDAHAPIGSEVDIATYWSEPIYDSVEAVDQPLHGLYRTGDPVADSFQLGIYDDRFHVNRPGSACYRVSASGPPWQAPAPTVEGGTSLVTITPYSLSSPPTGGGYDPLDSFFLPLAGFDGLYGPGPSIVISSC
jgi:hypothetical protein